MSEDSKVIKRSFNDNVNKTKERARALLNTVVPADAPAEQKVVAPTPAEQKVAAPAPTPAAVPQEQKVVAPVPSEQQQQPSAEPSYVPDEDDDPEFNVDAPKPEHWKKIKLKNRELKKTAKQLEEEKLRYAAEIEEMKAGLVIPEQVQSLTSRIQELEPYEKIYALKNSPAYVEQVTKPMNEEIAVLRTLETDYKLPQGVLQRVMDTENVAEQNRILGQYFDGLGADAAKKAISNMRRIQAKAIEAEKEPAKTLQQMEEDNKRFLQTRRATQRQSVANTSREAWLESLSGLRKEGKYTELNYMEGHDKHNEEVVKPLITRASQEYGRMVRELAENGLETLPKEVATGLAQAVQIKHQGLIAIAERDALRAELDSLKQSINRSNTINRPSASGGMTFVPQTNEESRPLRPSNVPGSSATSNNRLKEKARNLLQQS